MGLSTAVWLEQCSVTCSHWSWPLVLCVFCVQPVGVGSPGRCFFLHLPHPSAWSLVTHLSLLDAVTSAPPWLPLLSTALAKWVSVSCLLALC